MQNGTKSNIGVKFLLVSVLLILAAIAIAVALAMWLPTGTKFNVNDLSSGFAVMASLVTALAFLGLLYQLYVTNKELVEGQRQFNANQEILRKNTTALEGQQIALTQQVSLMTEQSIENRFFSLMDLLQSVTNSVRIVSGIGPQYAEAREAFQTILTKMRGSVVRRPETEVNDLAAEERREQLSREFFNFQKDYSNVIGHYFRLLYHIVSYVHTSSVSEEKKRDFVRVIRAQLSQSQLVLLFYNGLTTDCGYPKFFRLIKRYDLLQNMLKNDLLNEGDARLYLQLDPRD